MAFCLFEIHARFVFTLVILFTWFIWFRVWTNKKEKKVIQPLPKQLLKICLNKYVFV